VNIGRSYLLLCLCIALITGCAPRQTARTVNIITPVDTLATNLLEQKKGHIKQVIDAVEERNREVEKTPGWIDWAYQGLTIAKLNDISADRYEHYRKYVDNGSVYIFVHPSYYLFFHAQNPRFVRGPDDLSNSIVDIFLQNSPYNAVTQLEQEQQKNEKSFMEYLTTGEKLVILILPRDYLHSANYGYIHGPDEYARYLNGIANGASSILYIESASSSSGKLFADDLIPLLSFLKAVGARTVLIGGGYVGRCQREFYQYVTNFEFAGTYYLVPELSTFSPEDISEKTASGFIGNFKLNPQSRDEFVLLHTPGDVNIQHLPPQYTDTVLQKDTGSPGGEPPVPVEYNIQLSSPALTPLRKPAGPFETISTHPDGDAGTAVVRKVSS